ncbi:MAG: hypothetical protein M1826_006076 [Phylliscum demangeonii]|nr:MAG: hypothetical protein M1826_006076 [Phylliscum demangeonii]
MAQPTMRSVLDRYKLTTPFPTEWPKERDQADDEDQGAGLVDPKSIAPNRRRQSSSRYSVLESTSGAGGLSTAGAGKHADQQPFVRDGPDPLGASDSLTRLLRQRGLPVDNEAHLRDPYVLRSSVFRPALYLSGVHPSSSTLLLLRGLDYLTRSIDQKSSLLKDLVEANFERFVKAKATIDSVYHEMGIQEPAGDGAARRPGHTRHGSKASGHFRSASGAGGGGAGDGKKTTLDSGVTGLDATVDDVSARVRKLWGPAMDGVSHEGKLKAVYATAEKYQLVLASPQNLGDCIKRRDLKGVVQEYGRARRFVDEARNATNTAMAARTPLTETQIHQVIMAAQVWVDVGEQVEELKRDLWRRLLGNQPSGAPTLAWDASEEQLEEHLELIGLLLELGVQDNPIWIWLLSQYGHLKHKITAVAERFRLEVEYYRRQYAAAAPPNPKTVARHFRLAVQQEWPPVEEDALDTVDVIHLWRGIYGSLQMLLESERGLLGAIIDYWEVAQAFIDGTRQRTLPVGYDGQSRRHHRLSTDGVADLRHGVLELLGLVRDTVLSFFADPAPADLAALMSPPASPGLPNSATLPQSAFQGSRFVYGADTTVLPPSTVGKAGDVWKKFAFWPPRANSLSGVQYLGKMLVLIGTAASEMAALMPALVGPGDAISISGSGSGASPLERLRGLVGGTRERCAQAICAAWNEDAENCKHLEDWYRESSRSGINKRHDLTHMPSHFLAFETHLMAGMQKVLYVSEAAMTKAGAAEVVLPPPAKLLQLVRCQFVSSLYKALSGMVEKAEQDVGKNGAKDDDEEDDEDDRSSDDHRGTGPGAGGLNGRRRATIAMAGHRRRAKAAGRDRRMRMLLALSNLQVLRAEMVPQLIAQFENAFAVKLTDESKTIRDVLGQIDARLFHSYTRPTVVRLTRLVRRGIGSVSGRGGAKDRRAAADVRPTNVRRYVYEVLRTLVHIHAEVGTTTGPLTNQILSYLLEQVSKILLDTFSRQGLPSTPAPPSSSSSRRHPAPTRPLSLNRLMQATLDVEFIAQTLREYTTDKASDLQSAIYLELDKRTDAEARARLQHELPEMRKLLKALKEGTRLT